MTEIRRALANVAETELVARLKANRQDAGAFVELMRRYNQRMFRVARSVLTDDAEAEDAAQNAWIQAYQCIEQFEGRSGFGSWLSRIVYREALAHVRKRRLVLQDEIEPIPDRALGPDHAASDRETRALIEAAIDTLAQPFREVFVLRMVEELSVAETAQCLDIPEDTVKTRLFRAKSKIREQLQPQADASLPRAFSFAGHRCDRMVFHVISALGLLGQAGDAVPRVSPQAS